MLLIQHGDDSMITLGSESSLVSFEIYILLISWMRRNVLMHFLLKCYNKGWIQGLEIASDYNNLLWFA